jgi:hypothetical protein
MTVDKVIRGLVTAGFGVGAAAVFGVLGAQSADAAPAPASPPPSSPADIAKQEAADKRTAQRPKVNSSAENTKQDAEDKRTAADAGNPARKEERAQGRKNVEQQHAERKENSEGKGNSSAEDRKQDAEDKRTTPDAGSRDRREEGAQGRKDAKPKGNSSPDDLMQDADDEVPVLDKKSSDLFNRVVRQTLPGVLPRLPENAGGGGVAVSDQAGDARRTKVGGGVVSDVVSDQLGAGRLAADNVARNARLADTAARNKASKNAEHKVNSSADDLKQDADDKRTAADAGNPARKEARAKGKQAAKAAEAQRSWSPPVSEQPSAPEREPLAPAPDETKKTGDDPAAEKRLTTDEYNAKYGKPVGSGGLCVAGGIQAMESASGDACIVFDSRGVGWVTDQDIGVGPGVGAQLGLAAKGSNANIDELAGEGVYTAVSGYADAGVGGSLSVSKDRKYQTGTVEVGAGLDAAVNGGMEFTESGRWFDWEDVARFGQWLRENEVGSAGT